MEQKKNVMFIKIIKKFSNNSISLIFLYMLAKFVIDPGPTHRTVRWLNPGNQGTEKINGL